MSTLRRTSVSAQRVSGGRPPVNEFHVDIHDEASGAHVRIFMSPEEFALSMWSRGDIVVKAEWTGVEFTVQETKQKESEKVPCGAWGCTNLKDKDRTLCPSCEKDYREDPDAFK